ncbi:hypothetical protein ACFQ77_26165 [Streptomyces virginiae]|uniref:hypothetical protein n=1 Tax=Streptomyces virginiae TaxID=1961 RepID=UPI00369400F4
MVKPAGAAHLCLLGLRALLRPAVGMALPVLVHVLLTVVRLGTYVYVLSRAGRFFARPRVRRVPDRTTGVVLIGFCVRVATT